ncbi:hypothetical protein F6W96_21390 [Nocardia terpenica]|uniref:Uncharacterized protein n=1 Tax=Nocardia terpenica TaxID=455432 RepID=A0A6G9ZFW6_9NOCA|nr:hypothetical protein F6W96_21390 [Nocardia terpenica]
MHITFLGKHTQGGDSPTLYATDRGTYVVQGWKVPGHNDQVEISHPLLAFLTPGTCLGVLLQDTGHGTFILGGQPVTDADVLAQMGLPDHETCVEVPQGKEIRKYATAAA